MLTLLALARQLSICFAASFIYKISVHSGIIFPMWLFVVFYLLSSVIYQIPELQSIERVVEHDHVL
jgi:hypothetical protein